MRSERSIRQRLAKRNAEHFKARQEGFSSKRTVLNHLIEELEWVLE